jgi:hypothetical protein
VSLDPVNREVVESSGFDLEHALGILMCDLCADAFIERN